jgi:hypothetical protein
MRRSGFARSGLMELRELCAFFREEFSSLAGEDLWATVANEFTSGSKAMQFLIAAKAGGGDRYTRAARRARLLSTC